MFNSSTWPRAGRYWLLAIFAMVALVVAAACGGDDDDEGDTNGDTPTEEPTEATSGNGNYDADDSENDDSGEDTNGGDDSGNAGELDYSALSGDVAVDGSSTVFPISAAMAEEFGIETDGNVRVNVALSGSGGGFEKFCRGETQISNASRPITEDEVEACAENDIDDIVELQVAIDALSIVRHPENDWAQCLTVDEVVQVFSQDGASRWSDVRSDFPDEPIETFYPGADSGTFDYFVEVLEDTEEGATHTTDGSSSEDDNTLVTGVAGNPNAAGYFGLAYYVEAEGVEPIEVDNGDGCVEPSIDNALNGSYEPFSRPLFIYTREQFLQERPEVLGFVNFYLTAMLEDIVTEVGYAPMPEDTKQKQLDKLEPFLT